MHSFTYNGTNLSSLGFAIKTKPIYRIAQRNITFQTIYGRQGDVIVDDGTYKNVVQPYEINTIPHLTHEDHSDLVQRLAEWLSVYDGDYKILRDTYNPGYFCEAVCTNVYDIVRNLTRCFDTTVEFTRRPFWYSDEGQKPVVLPFEPTTTTQTVEIYNPEKYEAEPIIRIYGGGMQESVIQINDQIINIKSMGENGIEINTPKMQTLNINNNGVGEGNGNDAVNNDFMPKLKPGKNIIKFTADKLVYFKGITVIPNWCRL